MAANVMMHLRNMALSSPFRLGAGRVTGRGAEPGRILF
jgi:hypothetical protein